MFYIMITVITRILTLSNPWDDLSKKLGTQPDSWKMRVPFVSPAVLVMVQKSNEHRSKICMSTGAIACFLNPSIVETTNHICFIFGQQNVSY